MKTDKKMIIAAGVIGVVIIVVGMVWSASNGRETAFTISEVGGGPQVYLMSADGSNEEKAKQVVAMVMGAKITIDQAIKTALDNFPGKTIEAVLEKRHDKTVWDVEILTAEQVIMIVQIDAESGSVITTEEKMAGKKEEHEQKR